MATDFDAVVIGSGFGGAVTACRLAEAGYKVCILERGRRWEVKDYPRVVGDAWFWDHNHPEQSSGWFDIRFYPHMAIIQGSAVGGGSLHYANVSIEAKPDVFTQGWPPEVTYAELKPYYDMAGKMLNARATPENQWGERTRLMKQAAEARGYGSRFRPLELAVSFDDAWSYDLPDPHDEAHSKQFVNAQGQRQGTCVHLGYCDLGCSVLAKNTLDLNYIPLAEKHGAEVRPLHMVRLIEPLEDGSYRIHFDRIEPGKLIAGSATARIVVVSAGSLGSSELLLRCRDEYKTLPDLSPLLGHNWSSNGDFLTPATHPGLNVDPSRGVPIASGIDFLGESHLEEGVDFLMEDGGFPDVLGAALQVRLKELSRARPLRLRALIGLRKLLGFLLRQRNPLEDTMLWFANGRDAANGRLSLKKRWWLFGARRLHLDWNVRHSKKLFDSIERMQEELARTTGGNPYPSLAWTLFRDLATPHPLGGCKMGTAQDNGVVDHKAEVFGHRNLYVVDGAIIPRAIGNNPSRTIAALSERASKLLISEGR